MYGMVKIKLCVQTHLKAERSSFQNFPDFGFCLGICFGATKEFLAAISCLRLEMSAFVEPMTAQAAEEKESSLLLSSAAPSTDFTTSSDTFSFSDSPSLAFPSVLLFSLSTSTFSSTCFFHSFNSVRQISYGTFISKI